MVLGISTAIRFYSFFMDFIELPCCCAQCTVCWDLINEHLCCFSGDLIKYSYCNFKCQVTVPGYSEIAAIYCYAISL
jgi:hypothetical protein